MVFSSTLFLFCYFPIVIGVYFVLKENIRNYWLLFASLIFFSWSQPNYLWIILLNIFINYLGGLLIERKASHKAIFLIVTISLNLIILFYFKYFDFVIDSINKMFNKEFSTYNIILPIGISFFTFQGISYLIDVYRNEVKAQCNLFKLGLYISLFPQLIAGPIVRYKDVAYEIDNRTIDASDIEIGIQRFIIGLGKKVIIANTMAEMVDSIWKNGATSNSMAVAWIGSIGYTLQIFFDFSGYSDMAIGLGRMFGFHFNENFNIPYISKSITEFWRRWHISLSSWFRDYVYIPLGGNRKRVYLNLSIIFLLTGIWHGASWTFILWGGYNGLFILIERMIKGQRKTDDKLGRRILTHIYTLLAVNIGWVIFRADSIQNALNYLGIMFGVMQPDRVGFKTTWYLNNWTIIIMFCGVILSSELPRKAVVRLKSTVNTSLYVTMKHILLLAILLFTMMRIVAGSYNPFIYFQF